MSNNVKGFKCKYCEKIYKNIKTFRQHQNKFRCDLLEEIDKVDNNVKEKIFEYLLQKKIDQICDTINIRNNINQLNDTIKRMKNGRDEKTKIIQRYDYVDSNIDMLSDPDIYTNIVDILSDIKITGGEYKELQNEEIPFTNIKEAFRIIFEKVYFNDEYPENHCILISNKNMSYTFSIYDSDKNKWIASTSNTLEDILRCTGTWILITIKTANENGGKHEKLMSIYHDQCFKLFSYGTPDYRERDGKYKLYQPLYKELCKNIYEIAYLHKDMIKKE